MLFYAVTHTQSDLVVLRVLWCKNLEYSTSDHLGILFKRVVQVSLNLFLIGGLPLSLLQSFLVLSRIPLFISFPLLPDPF